MPALQRNSKARRLSRYLPLIVWVALISFASTNEFSADNTSRIIGPLIHWLFPNTSPETLLTIHFLTRKTAHFCEYAVLGFLSGRAFRGSTHSWLRRNWFIAALALVVVFALIDEFHQSFVPSRTASIYDSLIDMMGGLTALLLWRRKRTAD